MTHMAHKTHWKDLSGKRKTGMIVIGLAQLTLTAAAYRDLIKRPADQVEGPKFVWGIALLVNWIGPISYFAKGRKV
ncbi:Phospholipase_D-nuclease N-terminal [Sanguibacter gelidistatuariae]|uniref:Phospholipase_D-nuclease N-terminal n=1 Tax=Sanguibacter gelidistatuariae TaxID=1814289 RepID=A0A1G6Y0K0_9MICO|nr:PLDc N-terminal domain-containing protein [Sanguibacter gelidistatuariae]SDD83802.1 Phospholipase_D-nuclease N-terminal [Sanguibacter gelidistatuariae]